MTRLTIFLCLSFFVSAAYGEPYSGRSYSWSRSKDPQKLNAFKRANKVFNKSMGSRGRQQRNTMLKMNIANTLNKTLVGLGKKIRPSHIKLSIKPEAYYRKSSGRYDYSERYDQRLTVKFSVKAKHLGNRQVLVGKTAANISDSLGWPTSGVRVGDIKLKSASAGQKRGQYRINTIKINANHDVPLW